MTGAALLLVTLAAWVPPIAPGPSAMETQPSGPPPASAPAPALAQLPRATIVEVAARADRGFHFPYLLVLPDAPETPVPIIVEPNNDGESDVPFGTHRYWALDTAQWRYRATGSRIGAAVLVPVFPRFSNRLGGRDIHTHALARTALTTTHGPLRRIDRQLAAMIDDARERMAAEGMTASGRVLLNGFSGSAQFVLRWSMLHPERSCAVAAGGFGGLPTLPIAKLSGRRFDYPLGTADWEAVAGRRFDRQAHARVPQLLYLGGADSNDAVPFRDSYTKRQERAVRATMGMDVQVRVPKVDEILRTAGYRDVAFVIEPGVGHKVTAAMEERIRNFFRQQIASGACDRP
jgi:hypothetical protein